MATGEIKRLERSRGFGFIRPDGESDDVFFHTSALQGVMFDSLNEGQRVEFEKQPDEARPAPQPGRERPRGSRSVDLTQMIAC
jgi:CspA family cold shock protein